MSNRGQEGFSTAQCRCKIHIIPLNIDSMCCVCSLQTEGHDVPSCNPDKSNQNKLSRCLLKTIFSTMPSICLVWVRHSTNSSTRQTRCSFAFLSSAWERVQMKLHNSRYEWAFQVQNKRGVQPESRLSEVTDINWKTVCSYGRRARSRVLYADHMTL